MKFKKVLLISTIVVGLCGNIAFANPVTCDVNTISGTKTCGTDVYNFMPNNVSYVLYNLNPGKDYSCQIQIQGDHSDQVSAEKFEVTRGIDLVQQGRSATTINFNAANSKLSSGGMIKFIIHNGRGSFWKNESNYVYVQCS